MHGSETSWQMFLLSVLKLMLMFILSVCADKCLTRVQTAVTD